MYAVIMTGGKQYRVSEGDKIRVEKLVSGEGEAVEFEQVLMVGEGDDVKVGAPYVDGGKVSGTVEAHGRAKKIKVVKFKRRKGYMRTQGHRQSYTDVRVTAISVG